MVFQGDGAPTIPARLTRRGALRAAFGIALLCVVGCDAPVRKIDQGTPSAIATSPSVTETSTSSVIVPATTEQVADPAPSATSAPPSPSPRTAIWWTGSADESWLSASNEVARQITIADPGLTVRVSGGHSDFGRIVGGIASGQSPDVIDIGSIGPFASRGVIRTVDDYVGKGSVSAANYVEPMWLNGTWNGKVYGIPALDHGPELGLVWNQTLAGSDLSSSSPPKRWDELCRAGRSLTRPETGGAIDRLGFDPLDGVGSLLDTVRDLTGVDWYESATRRVSLANSTYQGYLDGVLAYYSAVGADRIGQFRQDVTPLTESADSGLNQGRQIAVLSGYWAMISIARLERDRSWQYATTWAPTLSGKNTVQRMGGRLAVIPANAKNQATSWDVVQFLASDSASSIFLNRIGRFSASRSFVSGEAWKRFPNLTFFLDSITSASVVSARGNNAVAGFAQAKWAQAIDEVLGHRHSSAEALGIAQTAVEAEVRRLGG